MTEEDIVQAPDSKRDWLQARIGRQKCSVVREAIAREVSRDSLTQGFEPSVPFVACLSASMVVGELVKSVAGWPTPLEPRFQFDVLRGPALGLQLPQGRRSDCLCVTRRSNIDRVRNHRRTDLQGPTASR